MTEIADSPLANPKRYSELVRSAQALIAESGSTSARLDAELLLRHLLQVDRVELFMRLEDIASPDTEAALNVLVNQRVAGQPIAYLTGKREFAGLSFAVTPDVLIPRPETELLVEWALDWLNQRENVSIVDVGTGSGAIAVSLATLSSAQGIDIVGSDISRAALDVATGNADRLLTPFRRPAVTFREGSLLTWKTDAADLVLANLPYLTPNQVDGNHDLDAEPRLALDGGSDGLDLVRSLVDDLPRVVTSQGAVGLELDPSQVDAVIEQLGTAFPDGRIDVIADLAGHRRHVVMIQP